MQTEPKPRKDETRSVPVLDRSEETAQGDDGMVVSVDEAAELEQAMKSLRKSSGAGVALTRRLEKDAAGLAGECNVVRTSMSLRVEQE